MAHTRHETLQLSLKMRKMPSSMFMMVMAQIWTMRGRKAMGLNAHAELVGTVDDRNNIDYELSHPTSPPSSPHTVDNVVYRASTSHAWQPWAKCKATGNKKIKIKIGRLSADCLTPSPPPPLHQPQLLKNPTRGASHTTHGHSRRWSNVKIDVNESHEWNGAQVERSSYNWKAGSSIPTLPSSYCRSVLGQDTWA